MLGISAVIGLQGRLRGSENPGVMGALVMEDRGKGDRRIWGQEHLLKPFISDLTQCLFIALSLIILIFMI